MLVLRDVLGFSATEVAAMLDGDRISHITRFAPTGVLALVAVACAALAPDPRCTPGAIFT